MMMSDQDIGDPEIDVQALLGDIDLIRDTVAAAAPGLGQNHHNYVRVSAIEDLVGKALKYVRSMKPD